MRLSDVGRDPVATLEFEMTEHRMDPFRWTLADDSRPTAPHVASMTWRHGLFVNWPVDPSAVRPHVPEQLTLETWDGDAWLSVLPFVLTNVGIRGTPPITRIAFPEINVRTYVTYRGDPGLFFFSIDVGQPLLAAAVGRLSRLPVQYADVHISGTEEGIVFSSRRPASDGALEEPFRSESTTAEDTAWFAAKYRPDGPVFTPKPETFEYWLTERRRFYAPEDGGVLAGEIAHDPWPLQPADATIHENRMFTANGLPTPTADPVVYYCDELEMTGSIPRRLR